MRQRGEGGGDRQPSGGSSSDGSRAVPRGSSDNGGSSTAPSRGISAASGTDDAAPSRRAVPAYSRPRDGRPVTGSAVERQNPIDGGYGGYYPTYPYYRPPYGGYYGGYFGSYWPGYGFGLGGLYYDPLWLDPSYYGGGYYGGGYYGGAGYGSSGSSSYSRGPSGSLRLKIKPRDAKVYVDGYFVGDVDSFDGVFQRLEIDAGNHRIEIRAEGYDPIEFEVAISPRETATYKGELKRVIQ